MSDAQPIHLNAEDMPWGCSNVHGVSFKTLRYDADEKQGAVMVHMCAGTEYPHYDSEAGQDVFVIDGELLLGEQSIGRGSYVWVPPGEDHVPRTDKGCVLFVASFGKVRHKLND